MSTNRPRAATRAQVPPESDRDLEVLLDYLKRSRGFDFTGYKRASLARRITKRMQAIDVRDYADYVDYLEVHPEEFAALFNTILINVTHFFRDEGAWEYFAQEVVPKVVSKKPPEAPIRVWSAGCASGEEAYTLAMVLCESLGSEAFKERVKIYATDVDEEALAKARQAIYTEREVEGVPPALLAKYFDRVDASYCFKKELRRQVIFGRHDLIQDAPISRVDILVCRNVLMYFNAETQARILTRFHFALNDHGVLFLGRAETLLTHASTFMPLDLKRRISIRVPRAKLHFRDRLMLMHESGGDDPSPTFSAHVKLRDFSVDAAPLAQIVVDAAGIVVLANERARTLFGISPEDVGRPLQDLKISYRPVELRSLLEQVYAERRPVVMREIEHSTGSGEIRWLDLQVVPISENGTPLGASLAFTDVSAAKRLQQDLEHANQELEAAYEELQSTNEELETTNEELQSTIEELETTNEELQSTNEELETMNEELQSTNEELTTMNEELRQRSDELNQVNGLLESILTSLRGGVIVVDSDMRVLVWNARAHDLWGLREEEVVGKHFLGLDIGLPVERLKQPMRAALSNAKGDGAEVVVDATNRRGKAIRCAVGITRLVTPARDLRGLILVMNEVDGTA
ncbi:MAG TPA: CheR family methyltransferase [Gemmatimonadaceae bacterium]|nr:CheR family methyltransferase [Gemmatimonadaceae bacterium]